MSNLQKLVEALRSGEYQQTKDRLKRSESNAQYKAGYCCLGVACDLYKKEFYLPIWEDDNFRLCDSEAHSFTPPDEVIEWLGITESQMDDLIGMNDNEGKSFQEIANYIEKELVCE